MQQVSSDNMRDSATLNGDARQEYNANPDKYATAVTKSDLMKRMSVSEHQKKNNDPSVEIVEKKGLEDEGDINYHCLEWWQVSLLMIAETISLGILSLPSVYATLGMPAGILLIVGLGLLATYTGYNIGLFKLAYPHVKNQADAGEVMGGPFLREFLGAAQVIFLTFIVASHVLTGLIALETIADNQTCTIVWSVIIAVVGCVLTFPRTLKKVSWFSIASFLSILGAVFITMIGAGIAGKKGSISAKAQPGTDFKSGFVAASDVIFAFAGHAAFLNFIHEMKKPEDFDKAIYLLQGADISLYVITSIVIYYYVGDTATSPALGNLGPTLSKVAYGVALPTIIIAGVINGNVGCKLAMQRIFKPNSPHYKDSTKLGWIVWTTIVISMWLIGWVIANVIPFFNELLSIITALFASIFTYGISGVFWLFLNPRRLWFSSAKMTALTILNMSIIAMSGLVMVAGLYASISEIMDGYRSGAFPGPFSCGARE